MNREACNCLQEIADRYQSYYDINYVKKWLALLEHELEEEQNQKEV